MPMIFKKKKLLHIPFIEVKKKSSPFPPHLVTYFCTYFFSLIKLIQFVPNCSISVKEWHAYSRNYWLMSFCVTDNFHHYPIISS